LKPNAVEVALHRALAQLRQALEAEDTSQARNGLRISDPAPRIP
jgi:hypothetical protein